MGRLLHTIGRVCQRTNKASLFQRLRFPLRLHVMVFQLSPADNPVIIRPRLLTFHVRHDLCPRHRELILPSRDGLTEENGQAAAYHSIGWICQSAYEQSKPGSAVAVLKRLPVMVFQQEHGHAAAYHSIGWICQSAYEQSKPVSAVAVLKRLPVMVLEKSVGRLLHTIGRVCQRTNKASLFQRLRFPLRLPVMVFQLSPADNPVITRPRLLTFHDRHDLRPKHRKLILSSTIDN